MLKSHRSWIEISRLALHHNVYLLRQDVSKSTILAPCVKGNAYGHGLRQVVEVLAESDLVDWWCVQSIEEAQIILSHSNHSRKKPILMLSSLALADVERVVDLGLKTVIYNSTIAEALNKYAKNTNKIVDVHLFVDTGMNCQGVGEEDLPSMVAQIKSFSNLNLEGVLTHYASSDEPGGNLFFTQRKRWNQLLNQFPDLKGLKYLHSKNSAACLLSFPSELNENLIRPGLAIYGLYPSSEIEELCITRGKLLKPALSWKTRLTNIRKVRAGESVSYGGTYKASKDMVIGLIPVGYYDGLDRSLSNRSFVLVGGKRCAILGRVCMNLTIIDLSSVSQQVQIDDEVVLIGSQKQDGIKAEQLADYAGTINYEVVTRINPLIPRIVVD